LGAKVSAHSTLHVSILLEGNKEPMSSNNQAKNRSKLGIFQGGWRGLGKKGSQVTSSDSSSTFESSENVTTKQQIRAPSSDITVPDSSSLVQPAVIGTQSYLHGSLATPSQPSRQSLGAHQSRDSLISSHTDIQNE
jgi:hypothetical protein